MADYKNMVLVLAVALLLISAIGAFAVINSITLYQKSTPSPTAQGKVEVKINPSDKTTGLVTLTISP